MHHRRLGLRSVRLEEHCPVFLCLPEMERSRTGTAVSL